MGDRADFDAAIARITADVTGLRALTFDNVAQQVAIARLEPLVAERVGVLREGMAKDWSVPGRFPIEPALAQRARDLSQGLLAGIGGIKAEERRLL